MSFLFRCIPFLFLVSIFLNTLVSPTKHLCHPDQKDTLLMFKNEFEIQKPDSVDSDVSCYPKTDTWVKRLDCCSWDGIICDDESSKVIGIDLSYSCLHGRLKSNSSLFRLYHLRDLSLAYNNFTASPIPADFGKLVELEKLNLSYTSLSGQIPTKFLQLTKLVSLDLSTSSLSINESFLRLLAQNLRNLRILDMSYVNISSKIPNEFSSMWSLRSLRLVNSNLLGEFPSSVLVIPNLQSINLAQNPNLRGNLPVFHENSSLQSLSFFETSFSGIIPDSISNLKHLTSLSLSNSQFSGKIPFSLGNLSHLSYLDLSFNNFFGEIPSSLGNLKKLTHFDVWSNKLSGNLPHELLNLTQLRSITLCYNQFTGFLPPNISQHSKLEGFYARKNSFKGPIPSFLFKIPSLIDIYLDDNQFSDFFGIENISLLPNLQTFFIGNNKYRVSPVDLNVFSPLKKLIGLSLSGIPLLTENITTDSDFPSRLQSLDLSSCNITEFPEFVRNQRNLQSLDISNNKIQGQVPDWLWKLQEFSYVNLSRNSLSSFSGSLQAFPGCQVSVIDLSSNAFQGPVFIPSRSLRYFFGSKNNFTRVIPQSLCGLSSLLVLDLSNNNLHGSIPRCLGDHIRYLSYLNLRNNHLNGSLPDIFMNANELRSLDVSHNSFVGKLPNSLKACLSLEVLNVGSNKINDTFPFWLNSLQKLQVLVLRSNEFHGDLHQPQFDFGLPHLRIIDASHNDFTGTIRSDYFINWKGMYSNEDDMQLKYMGDNSYYYDSMVLTSKGIEMEMERILTIYTAIDFSGNKFHGKIPESIGLLKELHVLNLSRNAFTGHIPSSFANLTALESLDISQNKISGEIPPKLGDLSSLGWINVSHNELVGSVPQGTQFQRQNCSSYEGNPRLYGLEDICGDIRTPTLPQLVPVDSEEEEEWFNWVATGLGFAPGVIFGLAIGYIVASHKQQWFMNIFGQKKHQRTKTSSIPLP